jgi:hypothetical protein
LLLVFLPKYIVFFLFFLSFSYSELVLWQAFNFRSEASKIYFACISELMILLLKFIEPLSYNSSIQSNLLHNVCFVRQIFWSWIE